MSQCHGTRCVKCEPVHWLAKVDDHALVLFVGRNCHGQLAIVKASIRMHQRDDVLEGMRVYKGAFGYDIQAILPDDRNRLYMMLVCQKVVA